MTSHGSTLSSVVSAWVLARYRPEEAWRFLQRALDSDVPLGCAAAARAINLTARHWQAVFRELMLVIRSHGRPPGLGSLLLTS